LGEVAQHNGMSEKKKMSREARRAYETLLKLKKELNVQEIIEMLPFLDISIEMLDEIEHYLLKN
jgi:hypothetical protein